MAGISGRLISALRAAGSMGSGGVGTVASPNEVSTPTVGASTGSPFAQILSALLDRTTATTEEDELAGTILPGNPIGQQVFGGILGRPRNDLNRQRERLAGIIARRNARSAAAAKPLETTII